MRDYQAVWRAVVGVLAVFALVGLAARSLGPAIVLAVFFGVVTGGAYVGRHDDERDRPGFRRRATGAGMAAMLATLMSAGLIDLFGGAGFLVTLLLAVSSPPCVRVILTKLGEHGPGIGQYLATTPAPPAGVSRPTPASTASRSGSTDDHANFRTDPADLPWAVPDPISPPDCRLLTEAALCRAWRHSFVELAKSVPSQRLVVAQRRQAYLDEMQRRDPRGFLRWLNAGARAASDPEKYLAPDLDPGAIPAPGAVKELRLGLGE